MIVTAIEYRDLFIKERSTKALAQGRQTDHPSGGMKALGSSSSSVWAAEESHPAEIQALPSAIRTLDVSNAAESA